MDAVVTDPPFFDNVHYSELADFFYVWHRLWFATAPVLGGTTRSVAEVQDTDAGRFADKLRGVFAECHRVLKDDGLLVFSYHHSREDGWTSVAAAVLGAGFRIVQAQPVKAEMSVAAPKLAATSPIDLDVMLVCRKTLADRRQARPPAEVLQVVETLAVEKVVRFNATARKLSLNDVRVVVLSQALVELSAGHRVDEVIRMFGDALSALSEISGRIHGAQPMGATPTVAAASRSGVAQVALF